MLDCVMIAWNFHNKNTCQSFQFALILTDFNLYSRGAQSLEKTTNVNFLIGSRTEFHKVPKLSVHPVSVNKHQIWPLKLFISLYSTAKCKKKFTPHRKVHRWNFFPLIPAVLSSLGHIMENEILFYIIQSIKDLSKMVLKLLQSPLYATMLMR